MNYYPEEHFWVLCELVPDLPKHLDDE